MFFFCSLKRFHKNLLLHDFMMFDNNTDDATMMKEY